MYDVNMQKSIADFKYGNKRQNKYFYSQAMINRYKDTFIALGLDAIIPVPVHRKKLRSRGYNQAALIARELSKHTNISCLEGLLVRSTDTLPQKELDPLLRAKNLKSAFKIDVNEVQLNKILLVDDIYTTGATSNECAKVLLDAGVKEVYITSVCIGYGQ